MATEGGIIVELYDLAITARKDDRFGRVVSPKRRSLSDLINIAAKRRTDLNPSTIRTAFDLVMDVAQEELDNGASVDIGMVNLGVGVSGVFEGDRAQWDSNKHSLIVIANPKALVRKRLNSSTVKVLGMASTGIAINTLTDVTTGDMNTRITPGGGINLTGSKIKIAGDSADNGITLRNVDTQESISVPANAILVNDPSKVSFVAPAGLPAGEYQLVITTQFSGGGAFLKEPRIYVCDYVLSTGE